MECSKLREKSIPLPVIGKNSVGLGMVFQSSFSLVEIITKDTRSEHRPGQGEGTKQKQEVVRSGIFHGKAGKHIQI